MAATHPWNDGSLFRIGAVSNSLWTAVIFPGMTGRTYTVESTGNLRATNGWTWVGSTSPSVAGPLVVIDPAPQLPRFYRVRVELQP